ncbi:MAG: RnfABCDGE type electron transport complex subunit G [Pseudomonadota bacterium]
MNPSKINKSDSSLVLVMALTLITIISATLLAIVFKATEQPIADALRKEKLKAISAVLGNYANEPDKDEINLKNKYIYPAKNAEGKLIGVAFKTSSQEGYSGLIELMMGVDNNGKIKGLYVLNHKETPGLGDKMSHDFFKKQFIGKNLENFNFKVKKDGGDVDAITAATITSRAVSSALENGLEFYNDIKDNIQ